MMIKTLSYAHAWKLERTTLLQLFPGQWCSLHILPEIFGVVTVEAPTTDIWKYILIII